MIGEILKRRRRVPFLALKQHRNKWRCHQQRRGNFKLVDSNQMPKPLTHRAITNLIMILQERDESMRRESLHRPTVRAPPTFRIDTVVRETSSKSFRQLRDGAEIGQVAGTLVSQDGMQRVMKIVIPLRIEAIAACFARRDDSRLIEIALRYHDKVTTERGLQLADLGAQLLEKMNRRGVEDRMDRIDTQTVNAI